MDKNSCIEKPEERKSCAWLELLVEMKKHKSSLLSVKELKTLKKEKNCLMEGKFYIGLKHPVVIEKQVFEGLGIFVCGGHLGQALTYLINIVHITQNIPINSAYKQIEILRVTQ